eukprot:15467589-Alexandrium_andersonii.AAC.1
MNGACMPEGLTPPPGPRCSSGRAGGLRTPAPNWRVQTRRRRHWGGCSRDAGSPAGRATVVQGTEDRLRHVRVCSRPHR